MAISNLLSNRVRVVSPKKVSADRYQFLDVSQAEPNLGVPNFSASLSGSPAIVVSDDQGNRGFVRSLDLDRVVGTFTGSFSGSADLSGSFSGSFFGDGAGLFNLPQATKLSSGSVTASVAPNFGFTVLSIESGSTFTGSLFVSGNVVIPSGSGYFSGSGEGLFNIPLSALNIESLVSSRIASGSATASISPNLGLRVNTGVTINDFLIVTGSTNLKSNTNIEGNLDVTNNTFIHGDLYVDDSIYAQQLFVSYISSSVIYSSGSNTFGDSTADRQMMTGSVSVTGSMIVTGSLSVSEKIIFNQATGSILSASVILFNQATGSSISASFTGSFFGDGRNLVNLPQSTRLASGSVTASVDPAYGFRVESLSQGSEFTGSVDISGSLFVSPFSGSGLSLEQRRQSGCFV